MPSYHVLAGHLHRESVKAAMVEVKEKKKPNFPVAEAEVRGTKASRVQSGERSCDASRSRLCTSISDHHRATVPLHLPLWLPRPQSKQSQN